MYVHIGLRMVNPDPSGRKQQATSHPQYKAIAFDFDLDVHCTMVIIHLFLEFRWRPAVEIMASCLTKQFLFVASSFT